MNAELGPGDVIAGKYRIERVLGEGGMGIVLSAMHLQLDQRVAIKLVHPQAARNAEVVARFLREARASVRIRSEHVVRVIDVGELPEGLPFMVMEFLEGQDLAAVVQERQTLPIEEAVHFILQACEAIGEAHALGIIHRDLKPPNLFLCQRADGVPIIKVLDFGISKSLGTGAAEQVAMTSTSVVMGSPLYMSPEQAKSSKNVDGRTDIWALGTILYELLAGRPPFDAENMAEVFAMILRSPPPPIGTVRPDVPAGLVAILLRSLEKDPANRYENVGEFALALADYGPPQAHDSARRTGRILKAAGIITRSSVPLLPVAAVLAATTSGPVTSSTSTGVATITAGSSTAGPWTPTKDIKRSRTLSLPASLAIAAVAVATVAAGGLTVVRLRRPTPEAASNHVVASPEAPSSLAEATKPVVTVLPTPGGSNVNQVSQGSPGVGGTPVPLIFPAPPTPSALPTGPEEKHGGKRGKVTAVSTGKGPGPEVPGAPHPPAPVAPAAAPEPPPKNVNPLDLKLK